MKRITQILIILVTFQTNIFCQWNSISVYQTFPIPVGVKQISSPKTNIIWACVFDTSYVNPTNQFYRSNDNGISWTLGVINTSGGQMDITSMSAINKDTAWAAINKHVPGTNFPLFYSKVLKTTDGGISWSIQASASFTGPTNHINFINFSNASDGICVGDSNTGFWEIYKKINGGSNWSRVISANIPANIPNEKGVDNCYDIHNNNIWFGTTKGRVYKSIDLGSTWTVANTGLNNIINISMKDSLNGLASDGISLIKTTDGGISWNQILYNGAFYKDDITDDPNSLNTYYSTGWKNGIMGSSYTNDGGLNWIQIDTTPHTVINATNFNIWSGGITYIGNASDNYLYFYNWAQNATILKNVEKINDINFYPNPFSDEINLQVNDNTISGYYRIEMYNQTGILLQKWDKIDNAIRKIDINHLSNGIYLFRVYADNRLLTTYKMAKE